MYWEQLLNRSKNTMFLGNKVDLDRGGKDCAAMVSTELQMEMEEGERAL